MRVPPVENPTCAAFGDYKDVPQTVPLNFIEDDVMWVSSNLSGTSGTLGVETIELINWIIQFGCASEQLKVYVTKMADCTPPPPPPPHHGPYIANL